MSGFFDQLIARGLGLGEVIRPRARLLFEPRLADTAPLTPAAFGDTEVEDQPLTVGARVRPPGRVTVEPSTVERDDQAPVCAQGETAATRLSSSAILEPRDTASGIRPGQIKVEDGPRLYPAANVEPRPARAAFNNDGARSRQAEAGTQATPPPPPAENASVAVIVRSRMSEVARDSAAGLRTAEPPSHSIDPPAARDVLSPQPPLVQPRASVEATRSREQPPVASPLDLRRPQDLRRPAEQEPAIQVTIGRIEVRAEQASPRPPAKERSDLKPMSLDEYLRRRSGRSGE